MSWEMIGFASVAVLCGIGLVVSILTLNRYKENFRQQSLFGKWPIKKVSLDTFDSRFYPQEHGPAKETEVYFIANFHVPGGISDLETWILCTLSKTAHKIFEFGTLQVKQPIFLQKMLLKRQEYIP